MGGGGSEGIGKGRAGENVVPKVHRRGMDHQGVYESAIGLVAAILIALAAERFRTSPDKKDREEQLRTAAYVLAGASISVTTAFGALAYGADSGPLRALTLAPLAFAWLVLVASYWTAVSRQFRIKTNARASTKPLTFGCLVLAMGAPIAGALSLIAADAIASTR
jgi:hypothetical protein